MRNLSYFGWLLAFTLASGCVTPAASQKPEAPTRWEHWCVDVDGVPKNADLEKAGADGWELVGMSFRPPLVQNGASFGGGATLLCFKRPR